MAIKALSDKDAWISATFIIGEIGDFAAVSYLANLLNNVEYYSLTCRHINDAIEKIILDKKSLI
ncbi:MULTISPECIES: hypothetical protein [Pelosinus]|uniref:hypothetical protein n=1 Tax=Pelosinus TaxID=365348 RepID=UPI0003014619|nr:MULTISPECIES: hypothetical protein [Pelosinus]